VYSQPVLTEIFTVSRPSIPISVVCGPGLANTIIETNWSIARRQRPQRGQSRLDEHTNMIGPKLYDIALQNFMNAMGRKTSNLEGKSQQFNSRQFFGILP
jgi:hypothetical protein